MESQKSWMGPLLILNLVFLVQSQYYNYYNDDLSNLGQRISSQVRRQLQPLDGLGDRINAQVQNNLQSVHGNLDTLGDRITANVEQSLKPVRALELNFKMIDGVGGLTVVTHKPSGRTFIAKNSRLFTCSSNIDIYSGKCYGNLEPFEITSSNPKTDWCFVRSYSQVNDQVCLGTNGISVTSYNNIVQCSGPDDSAVLSLTLREYKRMCSSISEKAEYRYFPDVNSPAHVPIPNENPYVKCENSQNNLCIFHKPNPLLNSHSGFQNVNTFVRSGHVHRYGNYY